jgi:tripartite-type tricarboxylate transporter receptor subunit TctC
MADHMSRTLGRQVLIENVAGAGGTVGVTRVAKASRMATPSSWETWARKPRASVSIQAAYDPRTDFEPIMNAAATPMLVVAKKDLPVKDFKEFVTYLKANAAKLNYGTGGGRGDITPHLLFLDSLLDVRPQHVPFRGSGPRSTLSSPARSTMSATRPSVSFPRFRQAR